MTTSEEVVLKSDLATLDFAQGQVKEIEVELGRLAGQDERVPLLVQMPGVAITLARALFGFAYEIGVRNLLDGISARQFVRRELDRIGFTEFERFHWGSKLITLPEELREAG